MKPANPPAVLLGGLSVARALGMAGIRPLVASADADAPVLRSRFVQGRIAVPPLEQGAAVAQALAAAGRRLEAEHGRRAVLFYSDDAWLDLVHRFREVLAPHYRFLMNEPEVTQALIDKDAFARWSARHALPVPRELAWSELATHRGAVLVKPRMKVDEHRSAEHLRLFGWNGKARVFPAARDLALDASAQRLREQLLVQEYVGGDDRCLWSFHGFADESGELLSWFVGRKLRTYPALTGMSSYLEMAHDDELARLARGIVARVPLRGPFKMDFKRDPDTGRLALLEVNARYNLWHYVGAKNGVNLPLAAYRYLAHGERAVQPARYSTKYRWACMRLDFKAFRELSARGELTAGAWLASLAASRKVYDLFAWDDPAPALHQWFGKGKRFWTLPRRLWRRLSAPA